MQRSSGGAAKSAPLHRRYIRALNCDDTVFPDANDDRDGAGARVSVSSKLVTVENNQDGPEKLQKQFEYPLQIKQSTAVLGIVFYVQLVEPHAIHDRSITTDTSWKILLGRGLWP